MGLFDDFVPQTPAGKPSVGGLFDDYVPQTEPLPKEKFPVPPSGRFGNAMMGFNSALSQIANMNPSGFQTFEQQQPDAKLELPSTEQVQQFYKENPNVRAWAGTLRDYGPAGVAMGAGALGGQAMGVTAPIGAGAGGLSYLGTKMVADPLVSGYNYLTGSNHQLPTQGFNQFLDQFLPSDESRSGGFERVMKGVNDAVADNVASFGAGTFLKSGAAAGGAMKDALGNLVRSNAPVVASEAGAPGIMGFLKNLPRELKNAPQNTINAFKNPNVTADVGKALTKTPMLDTALSAASGAASATAREVAPDSQVGQVTAGVVTPLSLVLAANGIKGGVNAIGAPQALSAFLRGSADDEARLLAERGGYYKPGRRNAAAMQLAANKVSSEVQDRVGDSSKINAVIKNLDEAAGLNTPATSTSPGYNPTSGTAAGENGVGLLSLEKGMVNELPILERYLKNKRAIDVETSELLTPKDIYPAAASPQESQGFIKKILDDELNQAQAGQKSAQQAALDAETDLANRQREIVDMSAESNRTDPSAQIRSSLEANMKAVSKQVDAEFAKIPQNIAVDVSETARKKVVEILDGFGGRIADAPDAVVRFASLTKKGGPIASGDAQKILQDLYAAQASAPAGSNSSRLIGELRQALDQDISKVESFSEPLKNARNFYREKYVPVYKSGDAFDVLYGRSNNAPSVAPSETIDTYMRKPESATQLSRGLQGASGKISDADEGLLRNWVESKMATKAGSKPSQESVMKFLRDNDATISQLPESAQKRVLEIAEGLGSANANVGTTKAALEESNAAFATTEARATKSGIAEFANANEPEYQVDRWLYNSQNARKTMSDLVAEAKKDKTGRALEGLRNAVNDSLKRAIKNPGKVTGDSNLVQAGSKDDWSTSLSKAGKLLEINTPTRRALEMLYSKDELNVLDRGVKQMQTTGRINDKATSASDTMALKESKTQLQQLSEDVSGKGKATDVFGAKQLRQLMTAVEFVGGVGKGTIVSSNEAKFKDDLLKEAILNPDIMKALLRRSTPKNLEMTKQAITPFINSWTQANQNQGKEEEKAPQTGKSYRYDPETKQIILSE